VSEPSLQGLVRSLASGLVSSLQRNKIPATLSFTALVVTTAFALNSQYDEHDRYRHTILPDLQHAEGQFTIAMDDARTAINETWRLHYFLTAHNKARDVLRLAKSRWPRTRAGRQAHEQLVLYYELVNEQLAIIRTEMSVDEALDYIGEWEKARTKLHPLHEKWAIWVQFPEPGPKSFDQNGSESVVSKQWSR